MLCQKEDCTGCEACFNICKNNAIKMIEDEVGFFYPEINEELCLNCNLCSKVCPILNKENLCEKKDVEVLAASNNKKEILDKSASGGVFSALAEYVILKNGVVYGAGFDKDFELNHMSAKSMEEIDPLRSSKYLQSRINYIYREVEGDLNNEKLVLFVGTPCQVSGLKSFLRKEYENLITVDLFCHGVPSEKLFKDHIKFLEEKYRGKITEFYFRNKKYGWKNFTTLKIKIGDKYKYLKSDFDSYMNFYTSLLSLRPSCYNCKFSKLPRNCDFSIADYWGIDENIVGKDLLNAGVSLVVLNSKKAKDIMVELNGSFKLYKGNLEEAIKGNGTITDNINKKPKGFKENFKKDYAEQGYNYIRKRYFNIPLKVRIINTVGKNNIRRIVKFRNKLRNMIGIIK
ncbi:MAG: 4Fe-4S dicluster domain-containing protein [Clostridium sp.]|nr:4Fe-4S dicluster domain-containing protein [Clostridium sp.]